DVEVPQNLKRDADNTYTYTFKGWDKEVVTKCAGSAEYKAVYEGKYIDYTVVFKDHDGTELSSKTYHYGDKVEVPAEPTRKEDDKNTYKFKEWDKDVDPFCKGDAEYKAVYSATEKTVDPEGKDPEGKDPEGKDPEGKDPEGKDPEGKDPEGKDPEGKDPEETKPGKRIKGDMNGDNEANNLDLVFLFKYVSENEKSDDESVYDFYEDGEVNNKDVVSLFRYVSSI
ncbi:MAG: InlB B-repeat-containing protein, partial [Clostridia bacterium]|nr:InlB B-repeat-containing protein [Clostridia bacterium]